MKARSIVLVLFLVVSLFLVAGCGPQVYQKFYGEAIHTYTPPSTPKLEDVPRQFLYDDDSSLVLYLRDDIVSPSSYDLSGLNGFLRTKMCSIVTGAGYQCNDMTNNPITGSFFSASPITGSAVSRVTGAAIASGASVNLFGCSMSSTPANSGVDHFASAGSCVINSQPNSVTERILGKIYATQVAGTKALRFCYIQPHNDYVVAVGDACPAGSQYDNTRGIPEVLGYVYDSNVAGSASVTQCRMYSNGERYIVDGIACLDSSDTVDFTFYVSPICTDTDGGINPGVRGVVTDVDEGRSMEDQCEMHEIPEVVEFFCDSTNTVHGTRSQIMSCGVGNTCTAGACVSLIANPSFTVDKTSVYNAAANRIDYTIVVTNTGDEITIPGVLNIVDTLPNNIVSIDTNSMVPLPSSTLSYLGSTKIVWTLNSMDNTPGGTAYAPVNPVGMTTYNSEGVFTIRFSATVDPALYANVTNFVNVSLYGLSFTDTDKVQVGVAPLPASASEAGVTLYGCRRWSRGHLDSYDHYVSNEYPCSMENSIDSGTSITQSVLGRVFATPKPGTTPLRFCYRNIDDNTPMDKWLPDEYVVSLGDSCSHNGYDNRPGIPEVLGYVYATQQPGTVPVTQCRTPDYSGKERYVVYGSLCKDHIADFAEFTFYVYPVCMDSDGGNNVNVKGTAYDVDHPDEAGTDYCTSDNTMINEFYCDPSRVPRVFGDERVACRAGYSCSDGACVPGMALSEYNFNLHKEGELKSQVNRQIGYNIVVDNAGPRLIAPMVGVLKEYLPEGATLLGVSPAPSFVSGNELHWIFDRFDSEGSWTYDSHFNEGIGYNTYRSDGRFLVNLNVSMSPLITVDEIVNRVNFTINNTVVASDFKLVDNPASLVPGVVFNVTKTSVYDASRRRVNYTVTVRNLGVPVNSSGFELMLQDVIPAEISSVDFISPAPSMVVGSKPVWIFDSFKNLGTSGYTGRLVTDSSTYYSSNGTFVVKIVGTLASNLALNTPVLNYANFSLTRFSGGVGSVVYLVEATDRIFAGAGALASYRISIPSAITPSAFSTGRFNSEDTILVGTCGDNGFVSTALGGAECLALTPGKALLLLTQSPDRLIIAAGDAAGVNVAINVLRNSANYNVHGPRVDITYSGSSITGISFPHCRDGTRNFDETGVDCGGSCPACPGTSYPPATSGGGGSGSSGGSGRRTTTTTTTTAGPECYDDWICTAWTLCSNAGLQTRTCSLNDYPDCTLIVQRPSEQQSCKPVVVSPPVGPVENCFDGLQNQNEEGIDCGGICARCPGKVSWLVPLIIVLVIAASALGFLVYYNKFLKKPDVLSPLRKYVKDARGKSIPDARIKQILVNQGWSQSDIGKVMK